MFIKLKERPTAFQIYMEPLSAPLASQSYTTIHFSTLLDKVPQLTDNHRLGKYLKSLLARCRGLSNDKATPRTLRYFSELGFGVRPLVSVRVVLQGQLVEGLLDLALGGIFGHPQYVVVVPLGQDELGDEQNMHC